MRVNTERPACVPRATMAALMVTECSLVMFVMQAIVFSPWFKPDASFVLTAGLTVLGFLLGLGLPHLLVLRNACSRPVSA